MGINYQLKNFCPTPDTITDGFNFGVAIDGDTARKLKEIKITEENQVNFQRIAREFVLDILNFREPAPYDFFENSLLVGGFYLNRGKGLWLTASRNSIESLEEKYPDKELVWNSSNVDSTREAYTLVSLFSKWAEYTNIFVKE